jgi:hypothetical protein
MRSFSPALQMSFWHFSDMRPCPTRVHYRHQSGRPPVQVHGFTPWLSLLAALPGPTVAMGRGPRMQNRRHHDVPRWPKSAPNGAGGPNTSDWTRCSGPASLLASNEARNGDEQGRHHQKREHDHRDHAAHHARAKPLLALAVRAMRNHHRQHAAEERQARQRPPNRARIELFPQRTILW